MKSIAKNNYVDEAGGGMETVGDRLLIFINKIGLSRNEIAKEADVVFSTVSNYLEKDELPGPKFLTHLVRRHRLNVDWLLSGIGQMFLGQECELVDAQPPGPTQDEQLVELKHRLAEQILAGVEMRDRHSRWLHRALAAIAKTAKAYGMTTDQHQAIMDAVLDPDEAMAKLAGLEAAEPRQAAAGE